LQIASFPDVKTRLGDGYDAAGAGWPTNSMATTASVAASALSKRGEALLTSPIAAVGVNRYEVAQGIAPSSPSVMSAIPTSRVTCGSSSASSRRAASNGHRRSCAHRVPEADKEAQMALACVVSFEGVSKDRMDEMKRDMDAGERPEGVSATEFLVLHDQTTDKSLAILFFESEDDYATSDAALNAMPAADTPGQRTSVAKYEVVARMTA